jgi:hypothetical protein
LHERRVEVLESNEDKSVHFADRVWTAAVFRVLVIRGRVEGGIDAESTLVFRVEVLEIEVHVISQHGPGN